MNIINYYCPKKHSKLIDSQCSWVRWVYLLKMAGVMCFFFRRLWESVFCRTAISPHRIARCVLRLYVFDMMIF